MCDPISIVTPASILGGRVYVRAVVLRDDLDRSHVSAAAAPDGPSVLTLTVIFRRFRPRSAQRRFSTTSRPGGLTPSVRRQTAGGDGRCVWPSMTGIAAGHRAERRMLRPRLVKGPGGNRLDECQAARLLLPKVILGLGHELRMRGRTLEPGQPQHHELDHCPGQRRTEPRNGLTAERHVHRLSQVPEHLVHGHICQRPRESGRRDCNRCRISARSDRSWRVAIRE